MFLHIPHLPFLPNYDTDDRIYDTGGKPQTFLVGVYNTKNGQQRM